MKYVEDGSGNIGRVVKLEARALEALRGTQERFRRVFGRKQHHSDKVFFEQYLHQGRDFWREIRETVDRARVDPMLAFAWQRTGALITQSNKHLFSKTDLRRWRAACKEYHALSKMGVDPFAALDHPTFASFQINREMGELLDQGILHLGSFIDKNTSLGGRSFESFVALYQVTRAFNCLKTVKLLTAQRPCRDALAVVRTLYECYLRLLLVRKQPDAAEALVMQALVGSEHVEFLTSSTGKINKSRICDRRTGKVFDAAFKFRDMATKGGVEQIHHEAYRLLSGTTHAGIDELSFYFSEEDGFFHEGHAYNDVEVSVLSVSFVALLLSELCKWKMFTPVSRRDAIFGCKRFSRAITALSKQFPDAELLGEMPALYSKLVEISRSKSRQGC